MKRLARRVLVCIAAVGIGVFSAPARATIVDRVVVRFEAADLGGPEHPRFVFEREMAFEARIEALAEAQRGFVSSEPYEERHMRGALERHITEEILQSLPVEPPVSGDDIRRRTISAALMIEQRVGGRSNLLAAATAEGMEVADVDELVLRQAKASLYLDRMVAPMLDPSDAELREVFRSEPTPFRAENFDEIAAPLRRWYIEQKLAAALAAFYQGARARIHLFLVAKE